MSAKLRLPAYFALIAFSALCGALAAREIPKYFPPSVTTSARYLERVSQFQVLKPIARNVMIGDSLTERGIWEELLPGMSISNRGLGSVTVSLLRENLPYIPEDAERAFVMVGVNDISKGRQAEDVLIDYLALLDDLDALKVDIVVQSTLLTNNRKWNAEIDKVNMILSNTCQQGRCTFVDLNSELAADGAIRPGMTYDGVHLNGRGYSTWSRAIRPLMSTDIDQSSNPG